MMRYSFFLVLVVSLLSCDTENKFPDPSQDYFVKFYGEDGDHEGVDFVANSDGTFILLGNENVPGSALNQQIFVVKVDAQGMVIWHKSFGINGDEFAKDIELTADGNVIIAAETQLVPGNRDVFVKVISQNGEPLDSVRIGLKTMGNLEADEVVNSISIISDGYIVVGSTTAVKTNNTNDISDALHIRLTSALDPIDPLSSGIWNNTSGNNDSDDVLIKMIEIDSKTYYGFGYTNTVWRNSKDYKYWIFSLGEFGESSGNTPEFFDLTGSPLTDDKLGYVFLSKTSADEFEYVLNGISTKSSGESQSYIMKLENNPFPQPQLPYNPVLAIGTPTNLGANVGGNTRISGLTQGGFLLLTNNKSASTNEFNISLVRLGDTFDTEGRVPIFFGGAGDDFAGNVTELPDGKIMIIGTMTMGGASAQTKMVLMKLNSNGKLSE